MTESQREYNSWSWHISDLILPLRKQDEDTPVENERSKYIVSRLAVCEKYTGVVIPTSDETNTTKMWTILMSSKSFSMVFPADLRPHSFVGMGPARTGTAHLRTGTSAYCAGEILFSKKSARN